MPFYYVVDFLVTNFSAIPVNPIYYGLLPIHLPILSFSIKIFLKGFRVKYFNDETAPRRCNFKTNLYFNDRNIALDSWMDPD